MAATRYRVLLVDDEVRTLELLGELLTRETFDVALARAPREAVLLLESQEFDAVVTDVVFDGVADGAQVLEAARESSRAPWWS